MARFLLCLIAFAVSCGARRSLRQFKNSNIFQPAKKPAAKSLPQPGECETPVFLAFDFTTSASVSTVRRAFDGMKVVFGCKVVGGNRYVFVVEKDSRTGMGNLQLPEDAQKSLVNFPVVKATDFAQSLGKAGFTMASVESLPKEVMFATTVWEADGMNEAQFRFTLVGFFQELQKNPNFQNSVVFVTTGQLPMMVMLFRGQDCSLSKNLVNIADPLGGPGCVKMTTNIATVVTFLK